MVTDSSWGLLVSCQATSMPRRCGRTIHGAAREAEDVPAAAREVELSVHRLGIVGEHDEADVHAVLPFFLFLPRCRVGDHVEVGDEFGLAAALELDVDFLVLAVGAPEPRYMASQRLVPISSLTIGRVKASSRSSMLKSSPRSVRPR